MGQIEARSEKSEGVGSNPTAATIFVGQKIVFISTTFREWDAIVISVGEIWHNNKKPDALPSVSLEYRNERGKLVRKTNIPAHNWCPWITLTEPHSYPCWKPKI